jgi:hypothetical protein
VLETFLLKKTRILSPLSSTYIISKFRSYFSSDNLKKKKK